MAVQVLINGVDVSAKYLLSSLSIKNSGMQGIAVCNVTVVDDPPGSTVSLEHILRVVDGTVEVFEGKIKSRRRTATPALGPNSKKTYAVTAQDYTHLLTQDVIDATLIRTGSRTDKVEVEFLLTTYGTKGIAGGALVQNTGTISRDIDYSGMNLYEALEEAGKWMGTGFYVDGDLFAHWFVSEANAAPFNLSDAPNDTTTFGYRDLNLQDDSVELVNAVWVVGTDISGWRTDAASIATYGRIETTLRDPDITTAARRDAAGDGFLLEHAYPEVPITLTTFKAGLKAGMTIQLTNAMWGITAVTYRIVGVTSKHHGSTASLAYDIELESRPYDLTTMFSQNRKQAVATGVAAGDAASDVLTISADLSVAGANLVPNSSFESGSAGSWTVGSVWAFGHDPVGPEEAYAGSKVARLAPAAQNSGDLVLPNFIPVARTDFYWFSFWSFLRARTAGNFQISIREYDAANALVQSTITTYTAVETEWTRRSFRFGPNAQVPGTTVWHASTVKVKIAFFCDGTATGTWDVDGVQLERGQVRTAYAPSPQELIDGQIGTTQIADDAISTPKLAAGAVVAGKIAANTITAAEIAASAITADELAASAVTADKIAAGEVTIAKMQSDPKNLIPNPGAEIGVTVSGQTTLQGWGGASTGWSIRKGTLMRAGDCVWQLAAVSGTVVSWFASAVPVMGLRRYSVSAWSAGFAGNTTTQLKVLINWYDQAGTLITSVTAFARVPGTNTTFVRSSSTVVAPATAVTARLGLEANPVVNGERLYVDDIEMEVADQDYDHAGGSVTITPAGITVTGGALTLTNPGGTVVIDGTSNMFKIAASGTTSVVGAANATTTTTVTLTALGSSNTITPAYLSWHALGTTNTWPRYLTPMPNLIGVNGYMAVTSGGAVTAQSIRIRGWTGDHTEIVAGQIVYKLDYLNADAASVTIQTRYYILQETAL